MSTIPTLYLSVDAGPAEGVADVVHSVIDGALAESSSPADLLGFGVVLASGQYVDGSSVERPGRSFSVERVRIEPGSELVVTCGSVVSFQVRTVEGEPGLTSRPDLEMLDVTIAVLERLPGDAVLDYEGVIWLVRQDGRIVLNYDHPLDAEQLALIPKPLRWAPMDFA
jgi:hypothetical protein